VVIFSYIYKPYIFGKNMADTEVAKRINGFVNGYAALVGTTLRGTSI